MSELVVKYDSNDRLAELEQEIATSATTVKKSFYDIGSRLIEIQESQLYKTNGFPTLEVYLAKVLKMRTNWAVRLMRAARVFDEIRSALSVDEGLITERLLRPLTVGDLTTEERVKIWEDVEELATDRYGEIPRIAPAHIAQAIAIHEEAKRAAIAPPELAVGDYCQVFLRSHHLGSKELRKWNKKIVVIVGFEGEELWVRDPFGIPIKKTISKSELVRVDDSISAVYPVHLSVRDMKRIKTTIGLGRYLSLLLEQQPSPDSEFTVLGES
jgi:hypothetical protein